MSGNTIHYFARGNTAKGLHSLLESNIQGIKQVFLIDGGTPAERAACLKLLADRLIEENTAAELLHCPGNPEQLEGIIAAEKQSAILLNQFAPSVSGPAVHYVKIPGKATVPAEKEQELLQLAEQAEIARQNAYACFQKALAVHDEWEDIYIQRLNRKRANELAGEWVARLIPQASQNKTSKVRHRFLGAATPEGAVDFVGNLTDGLAKRYFIKGRAGTGKSTMLKKIAAAAEEQGYEVEVYHCGFDPASLDMVIVRELGFAIFDSTAPHEYFPEKATDSIIDLYEEIVAEGTDEKFAAEIQEIAGRYRLFMNKGTGYLAESKRCKEKMQACYTGLSDQQTLMCVCEEIFARL
ncbi:AAA family ATPase [Bacillus badius]|uniref:ATPase component BioM of energizing module of biotin ECF transporter n=1 Tax=Bacillus badius TaxID=1455 RepID=A0ABR5AVV6_BACBA|nr:AAA family ATPase [Bacillus badius]KIL78750.1 ATPase component BioM of energizing module of biotin ECF transporter [Bacillus badius]MED4717969.1 hypothetical protein [Bacillus badius]